MKTFLIRLATALIPAKRLRKRLRRRLLDSSRRAWLESHVPLFRRREKELEKRCREKLSRGEPLRAAFVVCDASMFSGESVFERLLADPRFDPFVAVVPRVSRGREFLEKTLEKTFSSIARRHPGRVRKMFDPGTGKAEDVKADVVFTSIVYEDQTLGRYRTVELAQDALTVCLYYGYGGLFKSNEKKTVFLPDVVCAWRYIVSNAATASLWVQRNPMLEANVRACGYCKMDRLASFAPAPRARKKIIIAPHHTIEKTQDALSLSTFLDFADFFLELPRMFPEVDFTFRPHPLLFVRLATPKWWGPEKTARYEKEMEAHRNVEFQRGGDYFETFAGSDAMIHDCGSFLAEYFYTGKPQCYLSRGDGSLERQLLPFSQRLYGFCSKAADEEGIVRFIRAVVSGDDPDKARRDAFAAEEVCVNHPGASAAVVRTVLDGIGAAQSAANGPGVVRGA